MIFSMLQLHQEGVGIVAKFFNTTAICIPEKHYMVNIEKRLEQIKQLVDEGMYFTINRARQYGKTTTLMALESYLQPEYYVISMDFQTFDDAIFQNGNIFSLSFAEYFVDLMRKIKGINKNLRNTVSELEGQIDYRNTIFSLNALFKKLSNICAASDKPVVLIIDEVDSATNNQVFLDFLSQLRAYYIRREKQATFHSVILAGVYDVKNLKRKIRTEDERKINSPWNTHEGNEESESLLSFDDCSWDHKETSPYDIAADFNVDMSFSKDDIAGMLFEYEKDYHTNMNIDEMAKLLFDYTSGYPFLVSRICKLIDEKISIVKGSKSEAWTVDGFIKASSMLISEKNTLFESLISRVMNYPEINEVLQDKIFNGQTVAFITSNPVIDLAAMFGIIKNQNGVVVPANKVFARVLADYYLSLEEMRNLDIYKVSLQDKNQFVNNGRLDMKLILEKFIQHFTELYGHENDKFIEKEGRKYFLLYLRPIINGTGHYSLEAVTSSETRTDLIVYYHEEFFIIETKVWRGEKAHLKGEQQLLGYMENYKQDKGYLLTFNFNKIKQQGIREVEINGKVLIEAMV